MYHVTYEIEITVSIIGRSQQAPDGRTVLLMGHADHYRRSRISNMALDPGRLLADEGAEAAWGEEIGERVRELDSGAVAPIPWSEARRMILGR
jgi:hypothetical protein